MQAGPIAADPCRCLRNKQGLRRGDRSHVFRNCHAKHLSKKTALHDECSVTEVPMLPRYVRGIINRRRSQASSHAKTPVVSLSRKVGDPGPKQRVQILDGPG